MSLKNDIFIEKDLVLGNLEKFIKDKNPKKINWGIGSFRDENLKPYVFKSVKKSLNNLLEKDIDYSEIKLYDNDLFNKLCQKFFFGLDNKYYENFLNRRDILTYQTIGGSGAYTLMIEFLKRYSPSLVLYSNPTWDFHRLYLEIRNIPNQPYFYWDENLKKLNFKKLIDSLNKFPNGCYIILQPYGHNPTGSDFSKEEWEELLKYIKKRNFFPILDYAYYGISKGNIFFEFERIKLLLDLDIQFCICLTFSKNFGLYGERIGVFHLITENKEETKKLKPYFDKIIKMNGLMPIKHGKNIVENILNNDNLLKLLLSEIEFVYNKINNSRKFLSENFEKTIVNRNFDTIIKENGMFSLLNLNRDEIKTLKEIYHIYLLNNGRINISGLNNEKSLELIQILKSIL